MSDISVNKTKKEDEIDLGLLINVLKSKWHYYIIALIIFIALAFVYIKLSLPVYEVKSSILVQDPKSTSKSIEDFLSGDVFGSQNSLATEIGILGSNTVLERTINELNLQVSYTYKTSNPDFPLYKNAPFNVIYTSIHPSFYDIPFEVKLYGKRRCQLTVDCDWKGVSDFNYSQMNAYGEPFKTPYFNISISFNDSIASLMDSLGTPFRATYEFVINSPAAQVGDLLSRLRIDPLDKDADIAALSYKDNVAQRALDILNTIGKVYLDLDVQDKTAVASLTLKFVDQQMDATSNELSSIEQELQSYKEKNSTVNLSEEAKAYLERMNVLDVERIKSDIDLKSLDNIESYIKNNDDVTQLAPSSIGLPDPLLIQLIGAYQELQNKRRSLSYGMKNTSPNVKIIDAQILEVKKSLLENIGSIRKTLSISNKSLRNQISDYEANIKKVPQKERDLLAIQRKFDVNQNIFIYLLQKKAETGIAKATAVSDNKILDSAYLGEQPVSPNKKLILLIAVFLAVFFPTSVIMIQNFAKTSIANRDDLAKLTNIPIIGVVGHLNKADNLVVTHKPKSSMAEAFRSIRTNLRFFGVNDDKKTILITSSISGEGKSFVSLNLASIFAMQNYKVVVVGLDLRKPKLFQDLGITNDVGVSSYLIGQAGLEQIIKKTKIPNLDLIAAGPIPPNPAELIAKKEMGDFFDQLHAIYDYVIVDTAPLGIVSDAYLVMKYSQINVYIVRENYSKREFIRTLNDLVDEGKIKNLCLLLNDSDFSKSYGYSYGHNYGYTSNGAGYYDDDDHKKGLLSRLFRRT